METAFLLLSYPMLISEMDTDCGALARRRSQILFSYSVELLAGSGRRAPAGLRRSGDRPPSRIDVRHLSVVDVCSVVSLTDTVRCCINKYY